MYENVYHINYELETSYWWFVARNKIVLSLLKRFAPLNEGETVLDVGCGTGGFASRLASRYNVLCLDTSPLAIEYCRRRGLHNVFLMPLQDFPSDNYSVRAVFFLDVIEHIDDDYSVLARAREILSSQGYLIITVPAYRWLWSRHDEIHMHKRRYTKQQLKELLSALNFDIRFISYFNSFLFLPAAIKRFFEKNRNEGGIHPVDPVSKTMNRVLERIFLFEKHILPIFRFPFGLSIIAIAQKSS